MSAFFNSVFTSVSSAASALLTPEFWAVQWPLWRASILTCASILVFRFLFRSFVLKLTMYLKKRYHFDSIDSLVKAFNRPIQIYLLCLALYMFLINSPIKLFSEHSIIDNILRTSLIICFTWGIYNMCNAGHGLFVQIWKQSGLRVDKTVAEMVSALAHFLCILLGFAMIAEEWEYDITAVAAKDSLANIFGSIVIITERPFVVGDWISANNVEGIVEKVSFRSTCIRTFYQELVFVPNNLLSNTPITNYTQRHKYRIQFMLGVTYSTTREQMQNVCQQIRQLCEQMDDIYNEGFDVNFFEFGDSSLNIRIVCYAKIPADVKNYARKNSIYFKIRERFNLEVMRILEENGVSCAFPSRSIYFETPIPEAVKEK